MSKTQRYYKLTVFLLMSGLITMSIGANIARGNDAFGSRVTAAGR